MTEEPVLSTDQRTIFNQRVWLIARQIPSGKVASYGQIAALIPPPEGADPQAFASYRARWAGAAMKSCPEDVPWQRVLNSQGKISLPKESGGYQVQRRLLEGEGIVFDARDRIDLKRFGWEGPVREWILANGLVPPEVDYQQGGLFG